MIRLALLLGILVGLAILVRVLREPLGDALIVKGIALRREARRRERRKPAPNSGHWRDDELWDDEGLWSRVAGRMAP